MTFVGSDVADLSFLVSLSNVRAMRFVDSWIDDWTGLDYGEVEDVYIAGGLSDIEEWIVQVDELEQFTGTFHLAEEIVAQLEKRREWPSKECQIWTRPEIKKSVMRYLPPDGRESQSG